MRNGKQLAATFETPNICPECKCGIEPVFVGGCVNDKELTVQYYCNACKHSFIARYQFDHHSQTSFFKDTYPNRYKARVFSENLEALSPQFCSIYNQALQAEELHLSEICGLGYRKALEFLIKDFCILLHPDDEEAIKNNHRIDEVIRHYLSAYQQITDISRVSFWFGNDEAHYTRQYNEDNLKNLKLYIDALIYTIQSVLVYGDARDRLEQRYGNK